MSDFTPTPNFAYAANRESYPPKALLLCPETEAANFISNLAKHSGIDICAGDHISYSKERFDILFIHYPSISDVGEEELSNLSQYVSGSSAETLIWTDMDTIEAAYSLFAAAPLSQFLLEPSDVDVLLMINRATRQVSMNQLQQNRDMTDYRELHKISDELAGVAEMLAKIAKASPPQENSSSVSDKPISFRPAPAPNMSPFIEDHQKPRIEGLTAKNLRNMISLRRLRDKFFDAELFADPAWDIMLDLMAAKLESQRVSVSSLCIAAAVPPTTALRWITNMTDSGLLVRKHDPMDARRVFIELSDDCITQIEQYLQKALKANEAII